MITLSLVAVVLALLLGAMSPGPSFVLVVRTAAANSRNCAIATALGMGIGGIIFAAAALFGLQILLTAVPTLYLVFKIAGAIYLLYLAVKLWMGADNQLSIGNNTQRLDWKKSFGLGLATQLSNPKTAIVYASIFTAFLSAERPSWSFAVLIPCVFAVEFGWYCVVAVAFSAEIPRRGYFRFKRWIDRAAGAVMGLLAVRIVADSR